MARTPPDDDDERPRWRDADEDEEPSGLPWEEPEIETEREDERPVLRGTEPVARFLFLIILGCVLLGGVIALILALADWVRR